MNGCENRMYLTLAPNPVNYTAHTGQTSPFLPLLSTNPIEQDQEKQSMYPLSSVPASRPNHTYGPRE
jgi:hypothetical protein